MTGWGNLQEFDRWACVRRLPPALRQLMEDRGKTVFVAGGYIRSCVSGEPVNDIDIFVNHEDTARQIAEGLAGTRQFPWRPGEFKPGSDLKRTPNSWTLTLDGYHVQIIHRWAFQTPQECAESFDFTIARSAIWHDGVWHTICDHRLYADLAAKRLVYTSPVRNEDAGGSMLRVLKFYQRGYRIPLDSLGAVISRLMSGLKGEIWELDNEAWRTQVITGLLREVDPLVDPFAAAHIDTPGKL